MTTEMSKPAQTELGLYHSLSPQEQSAVDAISFYVRHGEPLRKAVQLVKRGYSEWPVAKAVKSYQKLTRLSKRIWRSE